jgi:2-keto-4-pentenoate hydratase/2-oxohepta-3-ene-1,7-dioic acid hydratase in catechol pathway
VPRYVRVRGPNGVEQGTVEDGQVVTGDGTEITPLDTDTMQLPEPYELLTPLAAPEIWCAGVTYERSRDARVEESAVKDVYTLVYDAPRPELFMKDAAMRRTVSPGRPIGIRTDSRWNVPEPEIGVVLGTNGRIVGYTIGNDVSSWTSRARIRCTSRRPRSTRARARSARASSYRTAQSRRSASPSA